MVQQKYLLAERDGNIALGSLYALNRLAVIAHLQSVKSEGLKAQPLLIPQSLPASREEISLAGKREDLLIRFGLHLKAKGQTHLMVMAVCQSLRQSNLQQFVPELMQFLSSHDGHTDEQLTDSMIDWLAGILCRETSCYTLSQAIQLVAELEQVYGEKADGVISPLFVPVDMSPAMIAIDAKQETL